MTHLYATPSNQRKMANKTLVLDYILPELEETGRVLGRGNYGEVTEMLLHSTKVVGKKIDCKDEKSSIKSRTEQQFSRLVYYMYHKS